MTNEQIMSAIQQLKGGRYVHLTKLKDLGNGIVKVSEMRIRVGCNYANLSINEGKQTGSLPWGKWVDGLENWVVEHKGAYYLRITSTNPEHPEEAFDVLQTIFLRDGIEISREEVLAAVDTKKLSSSASPVFTVKFENIAAIGG